MGIGGDGEIKNPYEEPPQAPRRLKKPKLAKGKIGLRKKGSPKKKHAKKQKKEFADANFGSSILFPKCSCSQLLDAPKHDECTCSEENVIIQAQGAECGIMAKPDKCHATCTTCWAVELADNATSTTRLSQKCTCAPKKTKKVIENERQEQAKTCLVKLSNERDFYKAEFTRLMKLFQKLGSSEPAEGEDSSCFACQKKQQLLEYFQRENSVLAKEKICLMSRLQENVGVNYDSESPSHVKCTKLSCKRIERERDMLKLDILRLEQEADSLRDKIRAMGEQKNQDYAKYQQIRIENENAIAKLEGERKELIKSQGLRRVTINSLEEKVDTYSDLLRVAQEEMLRVRSQYNQLKKLHEQCDTALLDTQAQLIEVEAELKRNQERKNPFGLAMKGKEVQAGRPMCPCAETAEVTDSEEFWNEFKKSGGKYGSANFEDVRKRLIRLDQDKDNLLNELDVKTEKIYNFKKKIEEKNCMISNLEKEIQTLRKDLKNMEAQMSSITEIYKKSQLSFGQIMMDKNQKDAEINAIKTNLKEKEKENITLRTEKDQLNKEILALTATNKNLQTELQQAKIQISVAMESVGELEKTVEDKEKDIEEFIVNKRVATQVLAVHKNQLKEKQFEVEQLLEDKESLEKDSQELKTKIESHEKIIGHLKCQCSELESEMTCMRDKDQLISDLNNTIYELKIIRDRLERENLCVKETNKKLENKLFQCACSICDTVPEKCSIITHSFKDYLECGCAKNSETRRPSEKRESGVQLKYQKRLSKSPPTVTVGAEVSFADRTSSIDTKSSIQTMLSNSKLIASATDTIKSILPYRSNIDERKSYDGKKSQMHFVVDKDDDEGSMRRHESSSPISIQTLEESRKFEYEEVDIFEEDSQNTSTFVVE